MVKWPETISYWADKINLFFKNSIFIPGKMNIFSWVFNEKKSSGLGNQ